MGEVYRAEDKGLTGEVAIKPLFVVLVGLSLVTLFHPNIVFAGSNDIPIVPSFRPHSAFGQYVLTSCKTFHRDRGRHKTLRIEGNARTSGRPFSDPTEGFGGHIRSDADIEVSGIVDGNATPGPDGVVRLKKPKRKKGSKTQGNKKHNKEKTGRGGVVTGSIEPATEFLMCSLDDLGELALSVQQNHQNARIPQTDRGRLPFGCDDHHDDGDHKARWKEKSKKEKSKKKNKKKFAKNDDDDHDDDDEADADDPWPFCLAKGETIHLPQGVYWFSSWEQERGSQVILDGYVRILLTGEIDLEDDARVHADGSPYDLLVFALPENDHHRRREEKARWKLDDEVIFHGLVYAPDLEGRLSDETQFNGSLLASEIRARDRTHSVRWIDETAPGLAFQVPAFSNSADFDVSVTVVDAESGLDPEESFFLFLDEASTPLIATAGDSFLHTVQISANLTGVPEGVHQLRVEARDRALNLGQAVAEVVVDLTPPTIVATVDPLPNPAGWNNTNVAVDFSCIDSLSGVATLSEGLIVETEGAGQVISGSCIDRAGNSANVSVTLNIDKTPPAVLSISDPPPNANGWNNTNVAVNFGCLDDLSGVATFSQGLSVETEGVGQVSSGTCIDRAGNSANVSVTLNIDRTPPAVLSTSDPPPNANGWNNANVAVNFGCLDDLSGVATFSDGVIVETQGAGQLISGSCIDRAGNSANVSVTLNIDKTPPTLLSTSDPPPNTNGWNNTVVTVSFQATDNVSGIATVTDPITLTAEGANQLVTGIATDLAGHTSTLSVAINLDRTPPTVTATVDPPPNPAGWNNTQVSVRFQGTDNLSGIDTVTDQVTLATEGADRLVTGTATDLAGNSASNSVTVNLDKTSPVVTLTDPPNLSLFNSSPITVSGTADDASATVVVVNGLEATVTPGGSATFTAEIEIREGNNTITAVATDAAGNVGTASTVVIRDTTPPVVLFETPDNEAIVPRPTVTVAGTINDIVAGTVNGDDVLITVNGIQAQVSNRTFVVPDLPLVRGPNTITARARDLAGNTSTRSIHVTFQDLVGQRINRVSGNNQSGVIGSTLIAPLAVSLVDTNGAAVTGRTVTFRVTRGDGTVNAPSEQGRSINVVTDTAGQAQALFTLGTRAGAGSHRVNATATGFVGDAIFYATALPAPASGIKTISGENQVGVGEQQLPEPFVVIVHDSGGNPIRGVLVTFDARRGGGNFSGRPTVTRSSDSNGRAAAVLTLGPRAGLNNNVVDATFPGLTGLPAVFTASGFASGNAKDTTVSGVVLDNSNNPVARATARILGTTLEAVTNDQGQFIIPRTPVGTITLEVDGTTTTLPGTWPVLDFVLTTISGKDNTIGMPIFLLSLDTANAKVIGGPQDVTLEMANVPGLALTVFANSVTCPDGSGQCLAMITQVHRDKVPMPPPGGAAPRLVWTIQPAGIVFDPPAQITYPNVDGLRPGQIVDIFSFDHDLGEFVSLGTGTVSEDGSAISSDPGVGIRKAGWGYPQPPPPPTTTVDGPPSPIPGATNPVEGSSGELAVQSRDPDTGEVIQGDGRFSLEGDYRSQGTDPETGQPIPQPHAGVDIVAPPGTPVNAAADGVVERVNLDTARSEGNMVVIDHGNGTFSKYMHLNGVDMPSPGQSVRRGDKIGEVGTTGNASRTDQPHLHFEIRQGSSSFPSGSTALDPTGFVQ